MKSIRNYNLTLLILIVFITLGVGWLLYFCIWSGFELIYSIKSNFVHSSLLEATWTTIPAITLINLISPSLILLYLLEENSNPLFTIKVIGHQWYWAYELSDFIYCLSSKDISLNLFKFTSYILGNEFLTSNSGKGFIRNLDVDKRLLLPYDTRMRLLVTAIDVLHSWTIPSFGTKIDACPGRLNEISIYLKRSGLFFGQCSEICWWLDMFFKE